MSLAGMPTSCMTMRDTWSAPGRIRTCGPLLRRQSLCPLSYGGFSVHYIRYAVELRSNGGSILTRGPSATHEGAHRMAVGTYEFALRDLLQHAAATASLG